MNLSKDKYYLLEFYVVHLDKYLISLIGHYDDIHYMITRVLNYSENRLTIKEDVYSVSGIRRKVTESIMKTRILAEFEDKEIAKKAKLDVIKEMHKEGKNMYNAHGIRKFDQKEYYKTNRERCIELTQNWQKENPIHWNRYQANYKQEKYNTDPEFKEKQRKAVQKYYEKDKEHILENRRKLYQKNKEKIKQKYLENREAILAQRKIANQKKKELKNGKD